MRQFALTEKIYAKRGLFILISSLDALSVAAVVLSLCYTVAKKLILTDFIGAVSLLLTLAIPFLLVSIARRIINARRPYEIYDFGIEIKKKPGLSFPSRHVFSAFAIATALLFESLPLGICVFLCGAVLSAVRVLLGLHFVRDVLAGALLGVLGALIGTLVF